MGRALGRGVFPNTRGLTHVFNVAAFMRDTEPKDHLCLAQLVKRHFIKLNPPYLDLHHWIHVPNYHRNSLDLSKKNGAKGFSKKAYDGFYIDYRTKCEHFERRLSQDRKIVLQCLAGTAVPLSLPPETPGEMEARMAIESKLTPKHKQLVPGTYSKDLLKKATTYPPQDRIAIHLHFGDEAKPLSLVYYLKIFKGLRNQLNSAWVETRSILFTDSANRTPM